MQTDAPVVATVDTYNSNTTDIDLKVRSPDGTVFTEESDPDYFRTEQIKGSASTEIDIFELPVSQYVNGEYRFTVNLVETNTAQESLPYSFGLSEAGGSSASTNGVFRNVDSSSLSSAQYTHELTSANESPASTVENDAKAPTVAENDVEACASDADCQSSERCINQFCTESPEGGLNISLAWASSVDLDLYVISPEGTIYSMLSTPDFFDSNVCHDESSCPAPFQQTTHLESLTLSPEDLQSGDYLITGFVGADNRDDKEKEISYTLNLNRGNQSVGSVAGRLPADNKLGERLKMLRYVYEVESTD